MNQKTLDELVAHMRCSTCGRPADEPHIHSEAEHSEAVRPKITGHILVQVDLDDDEAEDALDVP